MIKIAKISTTAMIILLLVINNTSASNLREKNSNSSKTQDPFQPCKSSWKNWVKTVVNNGQLPQIDEKNLNCLEPKVKAKYESVKAELNKRNEDKRKREEAANKNREEYRNLIKTKGDWLNRRLTEREYSLYDRLVNSVNWNADRESDYNSFHPALKARILERKLEIDDAKDFKEDFWNNYKEKIRNDEEKRKEKEKRERELKMGRCLGFIPEGNLIPSNMADLTCEQMKAVWENAKKNEKKSNSFFGVEDHFANWVKNSEAGNSITSGMSNFSTSTVNAVSSPIGATFRAIK